MRANAVRVPGLLFADNSTVYLDDQNEPQPDACLWRDEPNGPRLNPDGYIEGAPQLVVEVAASSASYDLHDKKEAYRRNGVREYVVWRVLNQAIDWFTLRDGRYEELPRDAAGLYKSTVFPGLWLEPAAMVRGELAGVLEILRQGLATPEHAAFVDQLEASRRST